MLKKYYDQVGIRALRNKLFIQRRLVFMNGQGDIYMYKKEGPNKSSSLLTNYKSNKNNDRSFVVLQQNDVDYV